MGGGGGGWGCCSTERFSVKIYKEDGSPLLRWLERKFMIQEAAAVVMRTPGTDCGLRTAQSPE